MSSILAFRFLPSVSPFINSSNVYVQISVDYSVPGEINVFYLFLQHILGWTLTDYTPLNCFTTIINGAYINPY